MSKKFSSFQEWGESEGMQQNTRNQPPRQGRDWRDVIPDECLDGKFFYQSSSGKTLLRKEFMLDFARTVAKVFETERLTTGQIRRFYGEVKRIQERIRAATDEAAEVEALQAIYRLPALALYAYNRRVATAQFARFIEKNVEHIREPQDLTDGFAPHFECVVGFAHLRDN